MPFLECKRSRRTRMCPCELPCDPLSKFLYLFPLTLHSHSAANQTVPNPIACSKLAAICRPFDSSPGIGRGLLLRIPPHGRIGRCHGVVLGSTFVAALDAAAGAGLPLHRKPQKFVPVWRYDYGRP